MSVGAFRRFALFALGWTLLVIVWGAFVRATGSGAGCGNHWPICNGELIPRPQRVQTVIEFVHRLTSGVDLLAVVGLVVLSRRAFPAGHPTRRWAWWSFFFMVTEALLGALLVKAELVENNATASRAVAMSIHLVNTFLLVAAMTRTTFHAWVDGPMRWRNASGLLSLGAAVLVTLVGISGAVAALGDTLHQQAVQSPFVELLIQVRIVHPLLAVLGTLAVLGLARWAWRWKTARPFALALGGLVVVQVMVGLLNVVLQAPVAVQLVHLLVADAVWIALHLVAFSLASQPDGAPPPT